MSAKENKKYLADEEVRLLGEISEHEVKLIGLREDLKRIRAKMERFEKQEDQALAEELASYDFSASRSSHPALPRGRVPSTNRPQEPLRPSHVRSRSPLTPGLVSPEEKTKKLPSWPKGSVPR